MYILEICKNIIILKYRFYKHLKPRRRKQFFSKMPTFPLNPGNLEPLGIWNPWE